MQPNLGLTSTVSKRPGDARFKSVQRLENECGGSVDGAHLQEDG